MDKLQMAHEMALAIQGTKLLHDMELVSEMAWKYADAMQAEAEKRDARKAKNRIERQLGKITQQEEKIHAQMTTASADPEVRVVLPSIY